MVPNQHYDRFALFSGSLQTHKKTFAALSLCLGLDLIRLSWERRPHGMGGPRLVSFPLGKIPTPAELHRQLTAAAMAYAKPGAGACDCKPMVVLWLDEV
jgi:hypothetical protein